MCVGFDLILVSTCHSLHTLLDTISTHAIISAHIEQLCCLYEQVW